MGRSISQRERARQKGTGRLSRHALRYKMKVGLVNGEEEQPTTIHS